jgi:hypothetical protein
MTLDVVRDPSRRMGGAALIRLPDAASGASRVTLRRDEGALCLGPHGWSGAEHAFGPYPIERDGRGAFLRVGPEIVDRMEAYLPVEIALPELGLRETFAWPDEILPTPGAFVGGGVMPASAPAATDRGDLSGLRDATPARTPAAAPAPTPEAAETVEIPGAATAAVAADGVGAAEPGSRGRSLLPWLAAALLLAAGAAGWWAWSTGLFAPAPVEEAAPADTDAAEPSVAEAPADAVETGPPAETAAVDPSAAAAPAGDAPRAWACARADLEAARAVDTAAVWSVADACAGADRALERDALGALIERGEGEAMRRWGRLLDPWARPPESPLSPDAADAAVNYRKALEAGVEAARADLDALCAALRADANPMSRPLVAIHCE